MNKISKIFKIWGFLKNISRHFFFSLFLVLEGKNAFHIAVLGSRGSGKTTFIARYYEYLRDHMNLHWSATCDDEATETYLNQTLKALKSGELGPTEKIHPLKITTSGKRENMPRKIRLHTYDLPGNGHDFAQLCKKMPSWDGVIFLLDPTEKSEKNKELVEKCLRNLRNCSPSIPIAFVFTKMDHPNIPRELEQDLPKSGQNFFSHGARYFARQKYPGIYKISNTYFQTEYFALSAFGDWMEKEASLSPVMVPDPHKPPIGIYLPFEWIYQKVWQGYQKKGFQIFLIWFLLPLAIILGILFLIFWL